MPTFRNGEMEAQRLEWTRARSHSEHVAVPECGCHTARPALLQYRAAIVCVGEKLEGHEVRVRTHSVDKTLTEGKVRL